MLRSALIVIAVMVQGLRTADETTALKVTIITWSKRDRMVIAILMLIAWT